MTPRQLPPTAHASSPQGGPTNEQGVVRGLASSLPDVCDGPCGRTGARGIHDCDLCIHKDTGAMCCVAFKAPNSQTTHSSVEDGLVEFQGAFTDVTAVMHLDPLLCARIFGWCPTKAAELGWATRTTSCTPAATCKGVRSSAMASEGAQHAARRRFRTRSGCHDQALLCSV